MTKRMRFITCKFSQLIKMNISVPISGPVVKFNPNDRYWTLYGSEIKIIGVTVNDDQKVHSCLGCHCVACAAKHAELQERLSYLEELVVCMSMDIANIRNAPAKSTQASEGTGNTTVAKFEKGLKMMTGQECLRCAVKECALNNWLVCEDCGKVIDYYMS